MVRLTDKEKIVLYGLVKYPELNDIELAQKIKIKRPTITAIRNRLEKQEVYLTKKIPDISRLGCEIINITHTEYNPLTPYKTRKTKAENQNTFLEIQTDTQKLTISCEKNYTQTRRKIEEHIRFNDKHGYAQKKQITNTIFPIKLSTLLMNFEFGPLMRKTLSIKEENEGKSRGPEVIKPARLNDTEKTILYALVKYPELREKEIAEKTDYTRQTVNNIHRKLKKEKLLKTIRVPNIKKLGLELIVLTNVFMKPVATTKTRFKAADKVMEEGSQVLIISNLLESAMLSVSKSYTNVRKTYRKLFSYYKQNDFIEKRPEVKIIALNEVKHYKYDYTTLTKNILDINAKV